MTSTFLEILVGVIVLFVLIVGFKSIRLVPQARVVIVQRLGRYLKTRGSGPVLVLPFMDKILPTMDMREQVVPFDPQAVITADNVGIQVATVVYYQIVDASKATYERRESGGGHGAAHHHHPAQRHRRTDARQDPDQPRGHQRQDASGLDEVTEGWGVRVETRGTEGHHSAARRAAGHGEADAGGA